MTLSGDVMQVVYEVIDDMNSQLPGEKQLERSPDTALFGDSSRLESLDLVNLVVTLEEKINEDFAVAISLVDERAMSQETSPFRTIGSLAQYISYLLEETGVGK